MNTSAHEVIDRLQIILGVINDSELCKSLNLAKTTVSTWRGRNSVPYALCVSLSEERNVSLDWLLTGHGAMYRNAEPATEAETLSKRHAALLELFDHLDEKQQREILSVAEEKERLNKLEELMDEVLKKVG